MGFAFPGEQTLLRDNGAMGKLGIVHGLLGVGLCLPSGHLHRQLFSLLAAMIHLQVLINS